MMSLSLTSSIGVRKIFLPDFVLLTAAGNPASDLSFWMLPDSRFSLTVFKPMSLVLLAQRVPVVSL